MKSERLHFAAMTIFTIGFVLSTSGWGSLVALGIQSRPSWSLCGQEMCSCLPTIQAQPDCPLCIADPSDGTADNAASTCSNTDEPTPTPKRLPRTERFDSISTAAANSGAMMFISFVFAARVSTDWSLAPIATIGINQDRAPCDPPSDLPTPPPRA